MEQMERYKRLTKFGTAAAILFVEIGFYYLLWTHYCNHVITMPFQRRDNQFMTSLYSTMLFILYNLYSSLKIGFPRKNNIIYSQFLAVFATNVLGCLLLAFVECYQYMPLSFVILTAVDMALVFFQVGIFQRTYNPLFLPRQLLLIYSKHSTAHVLEKTNSWDDKCVLTAAIRIDEGIERIMQEVPKYGGMIIGDLESHDRDLIFKRCYEMNKRIYMIPRVSDVLIWSSDELKLFNTVLLFSRDDSLQVDQLFCERVFDILSAGTLLTLGLPLLSFLAITIRLEDRGPIFCKQCRLTKDGKTFDILKSRTIQVNAEADGMTRLVAQTDDRITRIGKMFRAIRPDELPQVLNILKGDMSVVGPRPEHPEIAVEYKKEIPEFDYQLKVEAGLTGYAQIYGVYGTTPYDKLKFDLTYIHNCSVFLDSKLISMTPKTLFMREEIEGAADGQATAMQQTGDLGGELKF